MAAILSRGDELNLIVKGSTVRLCIHTDINLSFTDNFDERDTMETVLTDCSLAQQLCTSHYSVVQVMVCCLTMPCNFINRCWFVISNFQGTWIYYNCENALEVIELIGHTGGFDHRLLIFKLISRINILKISYEIAVGWMPQYLTDDTSWMISQHLFR